MAQNFKKLYILINFICLFTLVLTAIQYFRWILQGSLHRSDNSKHFSSVVFDICADQDYLALVDT